ncbi:RNA chaperone Hfq [Thermobrachium celere]|uniref:RNA-binding protein Hfq n=1 Tax=Thermobrachium celere DSM 8682 TaxID=941824 RepID=R7RRV4_9CLOT|nr:RNA chaperone Hfq [Thermobrachium celere]CDF57985.1 RNA-binding protein Hfq [Thermobrachium celere DSM 8682]
MGKSINNLQDVFLNNARKGKTPVSIHLVNGFQLKGLVKGFDSFTIILESEGKQILVYKHSVTTVTPAKPVLYNQQEEQNNTSSK